MGKNEAPYKIYKKVPCFGIQKNYRQSWAEFYLFF